MPAGPQCRRRSCSRLCYCGFGGSYSFTSHPDIERAGAGCVAMDCPGCLMQIRGGLDKKGAPVRAAHTIELLAEALD